MTQAAWAAQVERQINSENIAWITFTRFRFICPTNTQNNKVSKVLTINLNFNSTSTFFCLHFFFTVCVHVCVCVCTCVFGYNVWITVYVCVCGETLGWFLIFLPVTLFSACSIGYTHTQARNAGVTSNWVRTPNPDELWRTRRRRFAANTLDRGIYRTPWVLPTFW